MNSDEWTITKIEESNIIVENNETKKTETIPIDLVTTLFHPAYCISLYKSQGMTFDFPYTIYEWNLLNERQKYVALSRSTSVKNINIVL